nr:YqiA/YcfP family alpha/beta fold hydrolase [Kofleriaceae bacterium]
MTRQLLYLHGFASGPNSTKGRAFAARFPDAERLDLRQPSFEHLRLSAMIEHVRAAIRPDTRDCAVVGSSLGGLTAARVAERDARVTRLVLLAPAFQLMARWRDTLGTAWDDWQRTGWRAITDFTTGAPARIDFGFADDALRVDVGFPDVRVPTLVLHGVHDDVVPIDHARRFAAGRANVRLVELDDGHELVSSLPSILDAAAEFLA